MATRRIRKVANPFKVHPGPDYDPTYDLKRDVSPANIGVSDSAAVKASGNITFTGLPTAGQTLTVNGVVFTFRASAPLAIDILIGTDAADTAANTASKLNASTNAAVAKATYTATLGVVAVEFDEASARGNKFTLATNATNVAVTPTLTGGSNNRYDSVVSTFIEF